MLNIEHNKSMLPSESSSHNVAWTKEAILNSPRSEKATKDILVLLSSSLASIRKGSLNRVEVSGILLTAIHDACPEDSSKKTSPSYEDNFPSLLSASEAATTAASSNLPSNNYLSSTRPKRRIRPAQILTGTVSSSSKIEPVQPTMKANRSSLNNFNNIASLPSEDLEDMRRQILSDKQQKNKINAWNTTTKSTATTDKATAALATSDSASIENDNAKQLQMLHRLAQIYTCIIFHKLVPCTIQEIHYCLHLLLLSTFNNPTSDDAHNHSFYYILHSSKLCNLFAALVLSNLCKPILIHLGHEMCQMISDCIQIPLTAAANNNSIQPNTFDKRVDNEEPSFTTILSNIRIELLFHIEKGNQLLSETDLQDVIQIGSREDPTTNISIPFEEMRDSRHHFRDPKKALVYKNREEARDIFLFLLRGYPQQKYNTDAIDSNNASKRSGGVMYRDTTSDKDSYLCSPEKLIGKLVQDNNMAWFADFFCELLMQIGLSSSTKMDNKEQITETDEEILQKVGENNSERIQKLHKRILSPTGSTTTPCKKVAKEEVPEEMFPGNMEFFYWFIQTTDSYNFSMHLRKRLFIELQNMEQNNSKGLAQRIRKKKMVSRFLGFFEFSSNWTSTKDNIKQKDSSSTNDSYPVKEEGTPGAHVSTLSHPIIPLQEYILASWKNYSLISTIPWVVDFLWMAKWDDTIFIGNTSTSYYRNVLGLLRRIHISIQKIKSCENYCCSTLQIVDFMLETLFSNVVGLSRAEALPSIALPDREPVDDYSYRLDGSPIRFSTTFLFDVCPHLADLHIFVSAEVTKVSRTTTTPRRKNTALKKMRPIKIANGVSTMSSSSFFPTIATATTSTSHNDESLIHNFSPASDSTILRIQNELVDGFFHHHRQLKTLVEFVVDTVVKNVHAKVVELVDLEITSTLDDLDIGSFENEDIVLQRLVENMQLKAAAYLSFCCSVHVKSALDALFPPNLTESNIKAIAISLASKHALKEGEQIVQSLLLLASLKQKFDSAIEKKKRSISKKSRHKSSLPSALENSIFSLTRSITDIMSNNHEKTWSEIKSEIETRNILGLSRQIYREVSFKGSPPAIFSENKNEILDSFAQAIIELQKKWLDQLMNCPVLQFPISLFSLLELAMSLTTAMKGQFCAGLQELGTTLTRPQNIVLIVNHTQLDLNLFYWNSDSTISNHRNTEVQDSKAKAIFYVQLVTSNLVNTMELENSFLHLLGEQNQCRDKVESVAKEIALLAAYGGKNDQINTIPFRRLGKALSAKCILERCIPAHDPG